MVKRKKAGSQLTKAIQRTKKAAKTENRRFLVAVERYDRYDFPQEPRFVVISAQSYDPDFYGIPEKDLVAEIHPSGEVEFD